jgi:hypothetical protein
LLPAVPSCLERVLHQHISPHRKVARARNIRKHESDRLTTPRIPLSVSQAFARRAETLGFGRTRFHDLPGIHSTALLDAGVPVHTVAQRIGDEPATLPRNYTKRKRSKTADKNLSGAIAGLAMGFLGS